MKPGDFQGLRVFYLVDRKGDHPITILLYIGDLPLGVAEEYINELLCKLEHVVSMRFFADCRSFQAKWFGFVEMDSEAEANKTMEAINSKLLSNKPLTIVKRNRGMPESKLCSFCMSLAKCKKTEAERKAGCQDYMLKIEIGNDYHEKEQ